MKSTNLQIAMLGVFLFLAPLAWAQIPAAGNQSAAAPAPSAAAAEVPRLIKFSGTLLDALDRPLAGPVGVTFALHAQQTGGAALWMETQNVTPDAHGLYTVLLGANSAHGVPAELFASGEARWLEVQVERQAEQPRVLLVSVPYALKAVDADTLGGKPASAFALSGPGAALVARTTGVSAVPATSTGTPQPAATCNSPLASVLTDGTATVNSIPKFTTPCQVESSAIIETGGNVGIGTTTPAATLDVNGGMRALSYGFSGNAPVPTNATATIFNQAFVGPTFSGLSFSVRTGVPPANALTVDPSHNVSILSGNLNLSGAGHAIVFPDGTVQSTAVKGTGGGTITGVTAGTGLTGGGTSGGVSLSIDPAVVPQLDATSNTFTGSITANSLTGNGAGLTKVNAGALNGLPSTAFATVGANSFTGNQSVTGNVSLTGNLALPNTTSGGTAGVIALGGASFVHNFGSSNTFVGASAGNMSPSLTGTNNTGVGHSALLSNTTGSLNAAFGDSALASHKTGNFNAAFGAQALFSDTTGFNNSAFGTFALGLNTTGTSNSAFGASALLHNTTGTANAAFGDIALSSNTTGGDNAAFGTSALFANTTGTSNAAFGASALVGNTTGGLNAAFGTSALQANSTGGSNSAFGADSLFTNTIGFNNSAFGSSALFANTSGGGNAAFGTDALDNNTMGGSNSAFGINALFANTTGSQNSAFGTGTLQSLTSGNGNIAIGIASGSSLTTGSSNIYIGNFGAASESNTIRIGTVGTQAAAFMAGISGATSASGVAVLVNSSGQLGTTTSSRRFKDDIADMAAESDLLMKLRPVAFYYKPELDPTHTRQYGLVAEEVAQVTPQLVVFDKDGVPQTVRYHFVNAMLLNEVQKQRQLIEEHQRANEAQQSTIALQQAEIQDLAARLAKLEALVVPVR
jgi:trimeric autotransporter adhesin